ncbi:hypothetical protein GH733_006858 [Mirounga leonina]|nr:hypothetical protein GH733_006858 [Mirounga leonina]
MGLPGLRALEDMVQPWALCTSTLSRQECSAYRQCGGPSGPSCGTQNIAPSRHALKDFGCTRLSAQPCLRPAVTAESYLGERDAALGFTSHQKDFAAAAEGHEK